MRVPRAGETPADRGDFLARRASLLFYGYWDIAFLPVIVGSIAANYLLSMALVNRPPGAKVLLAVGIAGNLGLLGYFKYTNFALGTLNDALGADIHWTTVVLPIGISFFTFQQIAFLVDTYQGRSSERSFARYALFVSFFPQLIAGPIVHHRETMEQFAQPRSNRWADIGAGMTLLLIGLVKKMVIADGAAIPSSAIFDAAAAGTAPGFGDTWLAALCYALQIYFDFSAYSDMAVGLGRMFGIDLPINFASPYKARSIIDFWRRWHITLSRFLRDYLYVPLGGNRHGPSRRHVNLMLTMALGGIWHGAGWTFLIWGLLHGGYLLLNHAWSGTRAAAALASSAIWHHGAWLLTLLAVVVAWVPFRAADLATTWLLWRGMIGLNGIAPLDYALSTRTLGMIVVAYGIALLAPNSYELLRDLRLGLPSPGYPSTRIDGQSRLAPWLFSRPNAAMSALALVVVVLKFNDISEFIYFQF
ncbi:MAG: MBOAT family protein [Alphaproteobacteria bacterium]